MNNNAVQVGHEFKNYYDLVDTFGLPRKKSGVARAAQLCKLSLLYEITRGFGHKYTITSIHTRTPLELAIHNRTL